MSPRDLARCVEGVQKERKKKLIPRPEMLLVPDVLLWLPFAGYILRAFNNRFARTKGLRRGNDTNTEYLKSILEHRVPYEQACQQSEKMPRSKAI